MTQTPTAAPAAVAEPTRFPGAAWVFGLSLVNIGVLAGFFGPIQVLLAQQAEALSPDNKETALAVVTLLGAATSTVLNPVWGAFSDRTTFRRGRRLPWVVGGALASVGSFAVLGAAQSVTMMAIGWCLCQASLNAVFAAITAAVPDQVPVARRATVGGVVALCQTLGVVAGSGIAAATRSIAAGYLTISLVLVVLCVPYALRSRDVAVTSETLAAAAVVRRERKGQPRDALVGRDYWWAFVTRFLMQFGNALVLLYLFYFLSDELDLSDKQAESAVFRLTAVYALMTVITAIVGGVLSDRMQRRKPFVIGSGMVVAGALVVLSFASTMGGAMLGAIVLGLGFGMYQAVDFALITQVLPDAGDRARDLGILNVAAALPQVVAPAVGVLVIKVLDADYPTLYLGAAVVSVLGSWLVVKIKSVA